ncbi:MAG TPA: ABC transporter permease subunit [Anaerolineales bacterium]|jgi:ABC-type transport system involved in multi-copper enzyme maturation permease subunit|nr:ABC transporter permease subunit [Anaerolineales bacterium]
MKSISVLARMTFQEAIRRRIVLTGLVLGILFLILFSIGAYLISTEIQRETFAEGGAAYQNIMRTEMSNFLLMAGLYAVTFLSVAMGALLGADTLAGEINSGSIQTILTKPVRRSDVVFGKWLGFAGLLGLYAILMSGGVILIVFLQSDYIPRNMLTGLSLIYLESLLVMTISLAGSSAMPALATGGMVFGLYGLAFLGGWIEQIGTLASIPAAVQIGIVSSLIVPTEALWRRAAFEMQTPLASSLGMSPFGAFSAPSLLMVLYAILYLVVVFAIAVSTFNRRDI